MFPMIQKQKTNNFRILNENIMSCTWSDVIILKLLGSFENYLASIYEIVDNFAIVYLKIVKISSRTLRLFSLLKSVIRTYGHTNIFV